MTSRTLICCAYPFGYGPAAKLLHLAQGLREQGLRLVFLGTGIGHELAARSRCFADLVQAAPDSAEARTLLLSSAGVLSLMDREYAAAAVELGRPVYVADSLLWMRHRVPPVFGQARRYWAQEFVAVCERLAEAGPNAVVVGPIVAPGEVRPAARGTHLVVNLGGSETPQGWTASGYFDFVARVLASTGLGPEVQLLAGSQCTAYLRERYADRGWTIGSLPHEEALARMRTARWVVTAPGLTACLECFQLGVPTFFLPPQNYSQWWILHHLRARGLAPGAFHWDSLWKGPPVVERMPEKARRTLVPDAIRSLCGDERAEQALRAGLTSVLAGDGAELASRQSAFFAALGPNGTERIVRELLELV